MKFVREELLGKIVWYYATVDTKVPKTALIVDVLGNCVNLQVLAPDYQGMTFKGTVDHVSNPALRESTGGASQRGKNGCWDFVPWDKKCDKGSCEQAAKEQENTPNKEKGGKPSLVNK